MKPTLFLTAVLLAGVASTGCMGPEATGDRSVDAGDSYFQIAGDAGTRNGEASAQVGDTFTFTNVGNIDHTVTVHRPPDPSDEYIKDVRLAPGQDTTLTFDQAGTYHIFCEIHGSIGTGMKIDVGVS